LKEPHRLSILEEVDGMGRKYAASRTRNFWLQFVRNGLLLAVLVLLTGCSCFGHETPTSNDARPVSTVSPVSNDGQRLSTLSPAIDTVASQVLTNMHLHAWNPNAMTKGVVTGGLYINWKMSNPSITNVTNPGADGNPQHDHDPQVDLLYLTALSEYHLLHPQDHTYDSDLSRTTSLVLADFRNYNLPKGWIYFYLLQDSSMLHNSDLFNEAYTAARNYYIHWYDPVLGFVYNKTHTPRLYNPNYTLSCGAALIDAGLRWNQPDWVKAGEKSIDHTITNALNPQYHLFYNIMIVSNSGQDQVQDTKAEAGPQGQAVDALITAYSLTHDQQYLDVATSILKSLFGASGLWDSSPGGFFFALDMKTGKVITNYKETRGQALVFIGLRHYDQIKEASFAQQEKQLIDVLTNHFYQQTYHGFFYRVTADFQIYVTHAGQGNGVEDYFTTEAMGDALDALQQSELPLKETI
jgi:hypothetical protein